MAARRWVVNPKPFRVVVDATPQNGLLLAVLSIRMAPMIKQIAPISLTQITSLRLNIDVLSFSYHTPTMFICQVFFKHQKNALSQAFFSWLITIFNLYVVLTSTLGAISISQVPPTQAASLAPMV